MNNFHIQVAAREKEDLLCALRIILNQHRRVAGYVVKILPRVDEREHDVPTLILQWTDTDDSIPLDPMTAEQVADWVMEWLSKVQYPPLDHNDVDIDEEKGFFLYNENWGHVDDRWEAMCGIQPRWCWYGK